MLRLRMLAPISVGLGLFALTGGGVATAAPVQPATADHVTAGTLKRSGNTLSFAGSYVNTGSRYQKVCVQIVTGIDVVIGNSQVCHDVTHLGAETFSARDVVMPDTGRCYYGMIQGYPTAPDARDKRYSNPQGTC